jgi:hypothetical protein
MKAKTKSKKAQRQDKLNAKRKKLFVSLLLAGRKSSAFALYH